MFMVAGNYGGMGSFLRTVDGKIQKAEAKNCQYHVKVYKVNILKSKSNTFSSTIFLSLPICKFSNGSIFICLSVQ